MRVAMAAILVAMGCLLAPIALVSLWVADEISDPDRYVATMAPLATKPDVQDAVVERVTSEVAKPLRRHALSPAEDLVRRMVRAAVEADDFPAVWNDINRAAHRRLMTILAGEGSRVPSARGDSVGLDLTPVYERTKAPVDDVIRQELGESAPVLRPTIDLFSPADLDRARTVYTWLITLKWVAPILSPAFLLTGVLLAQNRRKTLMGAGLGLAASMVALAGALAVVRNVYLPDYVENAMTVEAGTTVFDALIGPLKIGLRALFTAGLAVAGVVFLLSRREKGGATGGAGPLGMSGSTTGNRCGHE
ncbi:hypothetical protein [Streptosporangium sp. NPDC087985]|uniref:hypothetical protein n=1 Tax=Streptosporangium sp. NPDC087985 TaxID=3366196 RepID=UPI00381BC082